MESRQPPFSNSLPFAAVAAVSARVAVFEAPASPAGASAGAEADLSFAGAVAFEELPPVEGTTDGSESCGVKVFRPASARTPEAVSDGKMSELQNKTCPSTSRTG